MKYLKIKTLEKDWCDKDYILLHAAFQILIDFIEQEKPGETHDWSVDKLHKKTWQEIESLYIWWKTERPARKDPLDDKRIKHPSLKLEKIPGGSASRMVEYDKKKYASYRRALKKSLKLEQLWWKEDQQNLHRLINLRKWLWT
jgi:hypothetical protein